MKTFLLIALIPLIAFAEDSPFVVESFPVTTLESLRAEGLRKNTQRHTERDSFLDDALMMDSITRNMDAEDPPLVIYHPRTMQDLHLMQVREAFGPVNQPKPKIIYQIGR